MEIIEKKTVDMLTIYSVSIATDKFIELDGEEQHVGQRHRISYENSESGREKIKEEQPEEVVNSVFAIWGDEATVEIPDVTPTSIENAE